MDQNKKIRSGYEGGMKPRASLMQRVYSGYSGVNRHPSTPKVFLPRGPKSHPRRFAAERRIFSPPHTHSPALVNLKPFGIRRIVGIAGLPRLE